MKQKIFTFGAIVIIIVLLAVVVIGSRQKTQPTNQNQNVDILYWGITCSHCHDTIKWIEDHQIEKQLTIVRKEVFQNRRNATELSLKAKICGMQGQVAVPFMLTSEGKCLIGTPDITQYLANKVKLTNDQSNASNSAQVKTASNSATATDSALFKDSTDSLNATAGSQLELIQVK